MYKRQARQEASPPVSEVFPVPPLPEVTTIAQPIGILPVIQLNYTIIRQTKQMFL